MTEIKVVWETEDYLVVNKPAGVVVNRAESVKGETVQDWVESRSWMVDGRSSTTDKVFNDRSGICHRLDKETSGCLLVAKNPVTLKYFLELFKNRKIEKKYTALVHGRVEPKEGEIVLPMKRSLFERDKWQVHYEGKRAVSTWKVQSYFNFKSDNERWKDTLSLLEVGLKTGRTHQIRVHFSFLGWPLFGDSRYLQKRQVVLDRALLNRHFLHAQSLFFMDNNGKKTLVTSELPVEFLELIKKLDRVC